MECFCTKYLNKYGQLNNKINKKSLDYHILMSDKWVIGNIILQFLC